jgi:hypothetical protein
MRPVRTQVITALAFGIGGSAGVLTYLNCHSVPQALLAGGTAASGTAQLLAQVFGDSMERPGGSSSNSAYTTSSGETRTANDIDR